MSSPYELELKFELPIANLPSLSRGSPLRGVRSSKRKLDNLISVYFDTRHLKLRRNAMSLRIRRTGRRVIQTLKRENGRAIFVRDEWEHEVRDRKLDLEVVRHTPLGTLLSKKQRRSLIPVFETLVRRQVVQIQHGKSQIELCIDKGKIGARGKTQPICEVELELKRGQPGDLFSVAKQLAEKVPLQLSVASKAERGYRLHTGEKPQSVKATTVVLTPEADVRSAFQRIAWGCLRQVISNQPIMLSGDSDGLHQMRVALRRLRAAISLFSDMLGNAQTEMLKSELKWLASELGPARELDIFFKQVVNPTGDDKLNGGGIAILSRDLRQRREDASVRAFTAAESARFRHLLLDAAAWIEAGDWINNPDLSACKLREQSIADAAAKELRRRWKKVLERGKRLEELNAQGRHRLRIQGKKLRYAAEFFASAFPSKKSITRQKKFLLGLERLQDALGDLNDIAVNERLSEQLVDGDNLAHNRRFGKKAFAAGRLSGREEARLAPVLQEAKQAYKAFAKKRQFWS